jgi:hypothetical protein
MARGLDAFSRDQPSIAQQFDLPQTFAFVVKYGSNSLTMHAPAHRKMPLPHLTRTGAHPV